MADVKRQWRVRWQRLGMSRPKVRVYETQAAAERFRLKLEGRMADAYPELNPSHGHCCQGTSYDCDCGGETWAERWARESARVPPLVMGPELDSRAVGEWEHEAAFHPSLVPDDVREAFEAGGRRWPIPAAEPVRAATAENQPEDGIPW